MIVNNIEPIGVAVSTSPPPRFSTQASAPAAEFIREGKHVLGGSAEPVQSRNDEGVTLDERVECPIELWSRRTRSGDSMVDVQVIGSSAGGLKIRPLPVRGLLPCRNACIPNKFRPACLRVCLVTNDWYADSTKGFRDIVMRMAWCWESHVMAQELEPYGRVAFLWTRPSHIPRVARRLGV